MEALFCPCCKSKLEITHTGRYQDISEHVSSPNSVPSLKDGYQCIQEGCVAALVQATWIEDGGLYMSNKPEWIG